MKLIIIAIVLLALCVFGLCFNIIFRKDGKFPDGEISHNKALREKGIQCAKVEEKILWGKKKDNKENLNCDNCAEIECSAKEILELSKKNK